MSARRLRPPAALFDVAVLGAGCGSGSDDRAAATGAQNAKRNGLNRHRSRQRQDTRLLIVAAGSE